MIDGSLRVPLWVDPASLCGDTIFVLEGDHFVAYQLGARLYLDYDHPAEFFGITTSVPCWVERTSAILSH